MYSRRAPLYRSGTPAGALCISKLTPIGLLRWGWPLRFDACRARPSTVVRSLRLEKPACKCTAAFPGALLFLLVRPPPSPTLPLLLNVFRPTPRSRRQATACLPARPQAYRESLLQSSTDTSRSQQSLPVPVTAGLAARHESPRRPYPLLSPIVTLGSYNGANEKQFQFQ